MNKIDIKRLTFGALFASVYVATTLMNPIGYGIVQFRISEILLILPFWDKRFILPSLLGVGMANFFSPLGTIDFICGLLVGYIAYYGIAATTENNFVRCVLYSILCGIIIGFELHIVLSAPFILSFYSIFLSQLIITILGFLLWNKYYAYIKKLM